jgi:hypothetical protein
LLELAAIAFAVCVVYGVIGNAIVLFALVRRKTPMRLMWTGVPFYLYGLCNRSSPPVSRALTGFALSTNIALLLAIPALIWLQLAR